MNEWLARARQELDERTPREKWLLVACGAILALVIVQFAFISPLKDRTELAQRRVEQLDTDLLSARRMAGEVLRLKGGVEAVQARIQTSDRTNPGTLIEQLARKTAVRIEKMNRTTVSGNEAFPETRFTIEVNGASLDQVVRFLHAIESSDALLITRSLAIKRARRRGAEGDLDVTLAVSSFERT